MKRVLTRQTTETVRIVVFAFAASIAVVACADDPDPNTTAGAGGAAASGGQGTGASSAGGTAQGGAATGGAAQGGAATGGAAQGGAATGGAASAATVPCGGAECAVGQVCCFNNNQNDQVRCDAPGACDAGQIELSCNHPDDCPGNSTCCSAFNGSVLTMACAATCDAADEFVMCSGPDQAACPPATTCSNAQAGMGYHYCAK